MASATSSPSTSASSPLAACVGPALLTTSDAASSAFRALPVVPAIRASACSARRPSTAAPMALLAAPAALESCAALAASCRAHAVCRIPTSGWHAQGLRSALQTAAPVTLRQVSGRRAGGCLVEIFLDPLHPQAPCQPVTPFLPSDRYMRHPAHHVHRFPRHCLLPGVRCNNERCLLLSGIQHVWKPHVSTQRQHNFHCHLGVSTGLLRPGGQGTPLLLPCPPVGCHQLTAWPSNAWSLP